MLSVGAKMAVELKEPALRLMTFIENNRQPEIAERFIGDLVTRPLGDIAADAYVAEPLKPLAAQDFGQFCHILAAAHGEIRFAAAFTAEFLRQLIDEFAGLMSRFHGAGRTECDDARLVAEAGAELHHTFANLRDDLGAE